MATENTVRSVKATRRLAWWVLGSAFAIWCIGALLLLGAARKYVAEASVSHEAQMQVLRGLVLVRTGPSEPAISTDESTPLPERSALEVQENARATVTLFDGTRVDLYPGSRLTLAETRTARFDPSSRRILLRQRAGVSRIEVARPHSEYQWTTVETPHGQLRLGSGRFVLTVDSERTGLLVYEGRAEALTPTGSVSLEGGQRSVLSANREPGLPLPQEENLVKNGSFQSGFDEWSPRDDQERERSDVPGARSLVKVSEGSEEFAALRVARQSLRDTHNETGLVQAINRNVAAYEKLTIRARVRIDNASLSGGGYLGFEYPMMIRVRYKDETGGQQNWYHGFYYQNPEGRPTDNAQRIPQGLWYSYEGDLMQIKDKPVQVLSLGVLGSGHTFDARVTDVALVAR